MENQYNTPQQIVETNLKVSEAKAKMPISKLLVAGVMAGAAIAHNFGLAGSADSVNEAGQYVVGGIQTNGQMAVLIALAALLVISLVHLPKKEH